MALLEEGGCFTVSVGSSFRVENGFGKGGSSFFPLLVPNEKAGALPVVAVAPDDGGAPKENEAAGDGWVLSLSELVVLTLTTGATGGGLKENGTE